MMVSVPIPSSMIYIILISEADGNFIEDYAIPESEWTDMQEIWSAQFSHLSMEVAGLTPTPASTIEALQNAEDGGQDELPMYFKREPDSDGGDGLSDLYEVVE